MTDSPISQPVNAADQFPPAPSDNHNSAIPVSAASSTGGDPLAQSGSQQLGGTQRILSKFLVEAPETVIPEDQLREMTAIAKMESAGGSGGSGSVQTPEWFSGPIEVSAAQEGQPIIRFASDGYLHLRIASSVYSFDILGFISTVLVAFIVLFVAWLVLGSAMEPGGVVFSPIITIFCGAVLGNTITTLTGAPLLVGMLVGGLLWGNIPNNFAGGTSDDFSRFLRNCAVAVILTRAGLTFKWALTRPVLKNVVLQAIVPQLVEGFVHAGVASRLYNFPSFTFALYQGAAIAASSTAVVIPGVVSMQEMGYCATRGPTILMLCSIAFDSVFAIWYTSFVLSLVFPDEANGIVLWQKIAIAPLQILGGALAGLIAGFLERWIYDHMYERVAKAPENKRQLIEKVVRAKSLAVTIALGIGFIFGSYKVGFPGSGTVAVVVKAGYLAYRWGNPEQDHQRVTLYHDTAALWDAVIVPCLFTIVGASIVIKDLIDPSFFVPALICILIGLLAKAVVCIAVCSGAGYKFSEKLFLAIGWCAKSTVQAATAGKILIHVTDLVHENWAAGDEEKLAYLEASRAAGAITNMVVVGSILICAIGAGVGMKVMGPKLLTKEHVDPNAVHAH